MNRWIVAVLLAVFVVPALRASSLAATFNLVGVQDPNLVAIVDFTYTYDSTVDVGMDCAPPTGEFSRRIEGSAISGLG